MRNISNEEKNLKRYLKNHISLNLETMVKFLITGMVGFSLTACGGGGGGGGGSPSDSKPPVVDPEPPVVDPLPPVVDPDDLKTTATINGKEVLIEYNNFDNNIKLNGVKAQVVNENSILITDENETHKGNKLEGIIISKLRNKYMFYKDGNLVGVSDGESGVDLKRLQEYLSKGEIDFKDMENIFSGIHKDIFLEGLNNTQEKEFEISDFKNYNQNYNEIYNNLETTITSTSEDFNNKLSTLDTLTEKTDLDTNLTHTELYNKLTNTELTEIKIDGKNYTVINGDLGNKDSILVNTEILNGTIWGQNSSENGINVNYGELIVSRDYTGAIGQRSVSGNNYNYGKIAVLSKNIYSPEEESFDSYGQVSEGNNYNYGVIDISTMIGRSFGQYSKNGSNYNYGVINIKSSASSLYNQSYGQYSKENYNYGSIILTPTSYYGSSYGQYAEENNYNYGSMVMEEASNGQISLNSNNYNYGQIEVNNQSNSNVYGQCGFKNYNYGEIKNASEGQKANISNYNYGVIKATRWTKGIGQQLGHAGLGNYNYGDIIISSENDFAYGQVSEKDGNNYNYGNIVLQVSKGNDAIGQRQEYDYFNKGNNYNYGYIEVSPFSKEEYISLYGQYSTNGRGNNYNYGQINAFTDSDSSAYGQYSSSGNEGGNNYNYGNIFVKSLGRVYGQNISQYSYNSDYTHSYYDNSNYGNIYLEGKTGYGMYSYSPKNNVFVSSYNYGLIEINNSLNDTNKDGVIDGKDYVVGMYADGVGARVYNYGTIRTNAITGDNITDSLGNSFDKVFMQGVNGGQVYNYGILENTNALATLSLGSGINSSTSAGYKAAGDFKLAGEMNIMAEIGKGDSYIKENFITAGGSITGLENLTTQGVYEIAISENKNEDNKNIIDLTMNKVKNIEDTVSGYYSNLIKNVGLDNYVYGEGNGPSKFAELVNKLVSTGKTADLESIFSNEYANLNGVILENSLRNSTAQSNLKDTKETYIEANGGTYDSDFTGNVSGVLAEDYLGSYKIGIFTDTQKKESKKVSNTVSYDRESYLLMGSKSLSENTGLTLSYEYSKNKYDNGAKLSTNYFGAGLYSGKKFASFNYTFLSDAIIGLNTMERSSTDADFNSYSISMTNRIEKPFDLSMMNLSAIGEIKTTLFGHEKIEQSGADLESSRNVTVDSKTNISNNLILGMKGSKNFNSLIIFDFFAGYEKELNNVNEWRDTFSLTELRSSEYATPVRKEKYGAIVGEIGIQFNLNDNFTIKGKVSGDSIGDKKATMGFLYKF